MNEWKEEDWTEEDWTIFADVDSMTKVNNIKDAEIKELRKLVDDLNEENNEMTRRLEATIAENERTITALMAEKKALLDLISRLDQENDVLYKLAAKKSKK